jgi:hypothetical protein
LLKTIYNGNCAYQLACYLRQVMKHGLLSHQSVDPALAIASHTLLQHFFALRQKRYAIYRHAI